MRLGKLMDYEEKGCYAIDAREAHLVAGVSWPKHKLTSTSEDKKSDLIKKHPIGFSAYGTQPIRKKLFDAATSFQIWGKTGGFINVPGDEWMPIPLKPDAAPRGVKVYQLGPHNKKLINETFNLLHEQGKME